MICPKCGEIAKPMVDHQFSAYTRRILKCTSEKCNATIPVRINK